MTHAGADESILRLERLIPSPPQFLFALWTEPDQLVRWWSPEGFETLVTELDTKPKGRWRTVLRAGDGRQEAVSGIYRVVEPPHRLVFTWAWENANGARDHESEVTVTFEPVPGGTRLVLLQQRFESKDSRDRHERGWSFSIDQLLNLAQ